MDTAHATCEKHGVDEIFRLFPTPFMRSRAALHKELVVRLVEHFSSRARNDNNASSNLSHTTMLKPKDSPLLAKVAEMIAPKLEEFGVHLLGERMRWLMKEMWVNVMDNGGRQSMHNHANSFVSGVVYLTPTHPASQTMFMKSPGGTDFMLRNDHPGTTPTEFSADKWISPAPEPGDLVLFPSYIMHAVPPNQGERRITLSFNAIPTQLDSWGYVLKLS